MLKALSFFPILILWMQFGLFNHDDYHRVKFDTRLDAYFEEAVPYDEVNLKGMIVPHHIVPIDKLTNMYATASDDAVEHVLLLSPDHFTTSRRPVLTSELNWQGSFGDLKTNIPLTKRISELDFVYEDDREIALEHGLTTHIPLIKTYFKNADVTVLAVSKQVTKEELDLLLNEIPLDTFVIASVDFSHYYPLKEANAFDEITVSLIEDKAYDQFFGMSDAYFDTPGVLYAVFNWADKHHLKNKQYDHSNSAYYFSRYIQESTSYFFIGFY